MPGLSPIQSSPRFTAGPLLFVLILVLIFVSLGAPLSWVALSATRVLHCMGMGRMGRMGKQRDPRQPRRRLGRRSIQRSGRREECRHEVSSKRHRGVPFCAHHSYGSKNVSSAPKSSIAATESPCILTRIGWMCRRSDRAICSSLSGKRNWIACPAETSLKKR